MRFENRGKQSCGMSEMGSLFKAYSGPEPSFRFLEPGVIQRGFPIT